VFDSVAKGLVRSVLQGYNGTIFAYGQTASGKTHTMQGSRDNPGILPLAVQEIMDAISETPQRAFLIRCSYLEIYNEQITDLLGDVPAAKPGEPAPEARVEIRESKLKVRTAASACLLGTGERPIIP
jgi:centromeric protein E